MDHSQIYQMLHVELTKDQLWDRFYMIVIHLNVQILV